MQVPFLPRNYRVITFDPRGNGRSDRPADPAAYADAAFASDIGAVLDATGTERAVLGAFCSGFPWALLFAAAHPQRVSGLIAIGPTLPLPPASPWAPYEDSFDDVMDTTEGWAKENRHHWQRDWRGYVGERQVVLILAPLHELSHGTLVIVTRHPPTPPAYGNNHALSPVTPLGLQVAGGSAKLGVWIRRSRGRLWRYPILRWSCWSGRPGPESRSGRRSITVQMRWSRRTGCARWWVAANTTWRRRPMPLPCLTR